MQIELPRTFEDLLRTIRLNGWQIRYSGGGHLKVYNATGNWITTTSSTPSDYRGIRNFRAALKRAGLQAQQERAVKRQVAQPQIEYFQEVSTVDNTTVESSDSKGNGSLPEGSSPRLRRGQLLKAVQGVLARHPDAASGLTIDQIFDAAAVPQLERAAFGARLAGYANSGRLERVGFARYRLARSTVTSSEALVAPQQVDEDDLKAFDDFLNSLARVEKIIRKHIHMAKSLQDALKAFGNR